MRKNHFKKKQEILFIWNQFGPYHMDRCEAVGKKLSGKFNIIGIEITESSYEYEWDKSDNGIYFKKKTLFPGVKYEETSIVKRFNKILKMCMKKEVKHIFICLCRPLEYFVVAIILRFFGKAVYGMQDSKFDDKDRFIIIELLKIIIYIPYKGIIVSGRRTENYLKFLCTPSKKIFTGYDTISTKRMISLLPNNANKNKSNKHFTIIARLIPKKNISTALIAYEKYRKIAGEQALELMICGSGELEHKLKSDVDRRKIDGVYYLGFLQSEKIANILNTSIALILPSTEEQWGLVVNEAVSLGVPILCSENVGARDTLVRTGVNGYIFEPDNPDGLAYLMYRLATDEKEWRMMSEASKRMAVKGDVCEFVKGVKRAISM